MVGGTNERTKAPNAHIDNISCMIYGLLGLTLSQNWKVEGQREAAESCVCWFSPSICNRTAKS